MSNFAQANRGTLIYDPFIGTGSTVLSCSHFGSVVFGSDLDIRVLWGEGEGKRIESNVKHFNISSFFGGSFGADFSLKNMREAELFDSICTDPPYGLREGVKKVGKKNGIIKCPIVDRETHIPSKKQYEYGEMIFDLLIFSAKMLKMNGKLVFWIAVGPFDDDKDNPVHPCFNLRFVCHQPINGFWSRKLLVYEKVLSFDPNLHNKEKLANFNDFKERCQSIRNMVFSGEESKLKELNHTKYKKKQKKFESIHKYLVEIGVKQEDDNKEDEIDVKKDYLNVLVFYNFFFFYHQKLTEKLISRDFTKCQYLGGIYKQSPLFRITSKKGILSKRGNLSKSGFSTSTLLVLDIIPSLGYKKSEYCGEYNLKYLLPTTWHRMLFLGS